MYGLEFGAWTGEEIESRAGYGLGLGIQNIYFLCPASPLNPSIQDQTLFKQPNTGGGTDCNVQSWTSQNRRQNVGKEVQHKIG